LLCPDLEILVETLLRKYLWALDLVVIALCAAFGARATATFIESGLVRSLPTAAKRVSRPMLASNTIYSKQVEEILKRNVFCSACPPILGGPPVADNGPQKPPEPQKTNLPIRLLAVMFAPAPMDPRWSIAVIRDNDEKSAGPYSIGAKIREATITDIEETRVWLELSGRKEYLDLIEKAVAQGAPNTPAAPPTVPSGDPLMAEMDKGIKKLSEHNYEVQRATVDSLLGNMSVLSRAARIVPEIKDGRPAGFRLFSVRPDGPFAKIGFQNGDVISAINGLDMSSPDKALEVYTKLRSASHLSIGMERNGQKITKEYNIR
jgi:general secretion pathway protein C